MNVPVAEDDDPGHSLSVGVGRLKVRPEPCVLPLRAVREPLRVEVDLRRHCDVVHQPGIIGVPPVVRGPVRTNIADEVITQP